MGFRDMCPRPARSWCEGSSIRPLTPGHYPTLEEQQELGLRLRLRLREGLWSRESRCAAWARLHRACSARHLSQRSKVIAITSSGKSFSPISPSLYAW